MPRKDVFVISGSCDIDASALKERERVNAQGQKHNLND